MSTSTQETAVPSRRGTLGFHNLNVTYTAAQGADAVHALENIDFSVDSGEFVSVIGPSGCGKSTMLRVVADLVSPTSGQVSIGG